MTVKPMSWFWELVMPLWVVAFALRKTIRYRAPMDPHHLYSVIVPHEQKHLLQQKYMGVFVFLLLYAFSWSFRYRMEIEAYLKQPFWSRPSGRHFCEHYLIPAKMAPLAEEELRDEN